MSNHRKQVKRKLVARARLKRRQPAPEVRDDVVIPRPQNPGEEFAPYLKRVLAGDLEALLDYFRNSLDPSDRAFYECLGFIVANGSHSQRLVAQRIMRSKLWSGKKLQLESYQHWKRALERVAREAVEWVKVTRNKTAVGYEKTPNRETLWRAYLESSRAFSSLRGAPGGRIRPDDVELAQALERGSWSNGKAVWPQKYLSLGLVPKQLFFLLARTAPPLPVSEAVRQYIAGEPLKKTWPRRGC